jgi:hypothetical protein
VLLDCMTTDRPGQVSEVAMVPSHVDHNGKEESKMMWHIKLQESLCVHIQAFFLRVSVRASFIARMHPRVIDTCAIAVASIVR